MSQGHSVPKHRQLPHKEQQLFRELLTFYEHKQYKKGLKAADQILKKNPNHGETIALKALTLHSSLPYPPTASSAPKAEEAEAMARLAVKKDITSHITWHVLGILAKTRRDWSESNKAFAMARKQDPENIPVLRDAIALLTHTRNYQAAMEARHEYLLLRPQIRASWLGLAIAHELTGDYEEALAVFDGYASTMNKDTSTGPEQEQIATHTVRLAMKAGKYEDALARLEKNLTNKVISPRGEASELKAEILVQLGRKEDAEVTYRTLLEQNADNLSFYRGFLRNRGLDISQPLSDDQVAQVLKALDQFAEAYPRSIAPKRMALDVARGEQFRTRAREYIVSKLERGIPSLFVDVKGVYNDPAKLEAVGEIVEDIVSKTEAESSLHGDNTIPPPTIVPWTKYFLALHLVHPLHPKPDYQRAIGLLDAALEHTPTLPEVYMAKAMVYKRAGDVQSAAEAMEEARLLDGQDRFLNGKAAKYWIRAGDMKKAEELLAMFTKKDIDAVQDLTDMQCLWFLTEEGDAYRRAGKYALALKRYNSVAKTFQEYEDDQYDFHTYCMRRMTFGAYTSLLRYEDHLRSHPAYFKSALPAIDIYVKVADHPDIAVEKLSPEEEAERKKAAKKAQKEALKAKKAAAASGKKDEEAPIPDADPRGEALLKTETPIADALKLWAPLEIHHAERIETWLAGYQLHARSGQYLLAMRDLRAAADIDKNGAGLLPALIDFRQRISDPATKSKISGSAAAVIDEILPTLIANKPAAELVTEDIAAHPTAAHIFAGGRALAASGSSAADVRGVLEKLSSSSSRDIPVMRDALAFLSFKDKAEADKLRASFHAALPLAWVFASDAEIAQRRAALVNGQLTATTGKADV